MLRRLSCFALALAFAASSVFSSAAWSADSFISGGEEYEPSSDVALSDDLPVPDVYAAPHRVPRMVKVSAADQTAADANTTGKLVVPATLPTSVDGTFEVMSKYYIHEKASDVSPGFSSDYWRDVVATFSPSPSFFSSPNIHLFIDTLNYTAQIGSSEKVRGLAAFCDKNNAVYPPGYISAGGVGGDVGRDNWTFTVNYDVSSFSSSAFSLDGLDAYCIVIKGPYTDNNYIGVYSSSVSVLVDGQQVLTLSRGSSFAVDFGGYVFSGSSPVSTISFCWTMPFWSFVSDSVAYNGSYLFAVKDDISSVDPKALTISFLDGEDVINAQNNKTKDDINKHEEYESQWTGSMTENFNKLDVGNFTFHSGLIAGFAMVSGIFMDLWRGMGDAAVAYVFPLTLGVVLMLLGRISRTGGKRGTEEGDDSS